MEKGGQPWVLSEQHLWLRKLAMHRKAYEFTQTAWGLTHLGLLTEGASVVSVGDSRARVGPLRRARSLGAPPKEVLPDLARALFERARFVGALGCVREAKASRMVLPGLERVHVELTKRLGVALERWRKLVDNG